MTPVTAAKVTTSRDVEAMILRYVVFRSDTARVIGVTGVTSVPADAHVQVILGRDVDVVAMLPTDHFEARMPGLRCT